MTAGIIDYSQINTVIDLCAANGRIEEFLPSTIKYIPVDYIKYSDATRVCNLNAYEFPDIQSKAEETCILLVGAIGYIHDWKWLIKKVAEHCNTFVCAHNDFARISQEYRRTSQSGNVVLFNHQIIIEAQKYGFKLVEAFDYRLRTVVMKFGR